MLPTMPIDAISHHPEPGPGASGGLGCDASHPPVRHAPPFGDMVTQRESVAGRGQESDFGFISESTQREVQSYMRRVEARVEQRLSSTVDEIRSAVSMCSDLCLERIKEEGVRHEGSLAEVRSQLLDLRHRSGGASGDATDLGLADVLSRCVAARDEALSEVATVRMELEALQGKNHAELQALATFLDRADPQLLQTRLAVSESAVEELRQSMDKCVSELVQRLDEVTALKSAPRSDEPRMTEFDRSLGEISARVSRCEASLREELPALQQGVQAAVSNLQDSRCPDDGRDVPNSVLAQVESLRAQVEVMQREFEAQKETGKAAQTPAPLEMMQEILKSTSLISTDVAATREGNVKAVQLAAESAQLSERASKDLKEESDTRRAEVSELRAVFRELADSVEKVASVMPVSLGNSRRGLPAASVVLPEGEVNSSIRGRALGGHMAMQGRVLTSGAGSPNLGSMVRSGSPVSKVDFGPSVHAKVSDVSCSPELARLVPGSDVRHRRLDGDRIVNDAVLPMQAQALTSSTSAASGRLWRNTSSPASRASDGMRPVPGQVPDFSLDACGHRDTGLERRALACGGLARPAGPVPLGSRASRSASPSRLTAPTHFEPGPRRLVPTTREVAVFGCGSVRGQSPPVLGHAAAVAAAEAAAAVARKQQSRPFPQAGAFEQDREWRRTS